MHMYNMLVQVVGVQLEKYAYVCHVAQVETTLQHCLADVCGVESVCVCVRGRGGGVGGDGGSVVSTLTGSPHNLMHTILPVRQVYSKTRVRKINRKTLMTKMN